jgi:hypothetical protein
VDLVEIDCVDREATSAIFDFLPDRIGTFLTSYGLEVAPHSIHAHGDAISEPERLRVLREHRGKRTCNNVSNWGRMNLDLPRYRPVRGLSVGIALSPSATCYWCSVSLAA